jgi:8-hydroxy-5-deazaflavin:NADPH oxidoreductase
MRIAVIGSGNVGSALGSRWAAKGHTVVYGVRAPAAAKVDAVVRLAPGATAATVADAARSADVVVLTTPWPATRDAVNEAGNLAGKIVIDCTNPLKADLSGLEVGHTDSAGEQVARWARGASVFKAFNSTGAPNMASQDGYPAKPVMFFCGDDAARRPIVRQLVEDVGFEAVDAGGIESARLLEPLAMLWIRLALKQGLGTSFALGLMRR